MHDNDRTTVRPLPEPAILGIGGVSEQLGLTRRALRFYEERELIKVRRDRQGRRVYDVQIRERLAWIAILRSAGLSLDEISQTLRFDEHARRSELASRLLAGRLQALQAQATRMQQVLEYLTTRAVVRSPASSTGEGAHQRAEATR
jgi:DNA-binding transcriptional MerR regulator